MCEIFYLKNDFVGCEAQIMELVQQKPSYDYWLAKGIILLGDNFIALNDYFNAKHSLKSIVDNYEGVEKDAIIAQAIQKLEYVENLELIEQNNEPKQQEMEVEFENEDPKDNELFDYLPKNDTINKDDNEN